MNTLFFRDNEIDKINSAYEQVKTGKQQILMVSGESGSGKSELVYKTIRPKDCFFIVGKFDAYSVKEPYSGFKMAFNQMIHQLLIEPKQELEQTKRKLKIALSQNLGTLLQLIPEFNKLIGDVDYHIDEDFMMHQSKLFHEIIRLLRFIGNRSECLVLFLDDLQWADEASLSLLSFILNHLEGIKILLIGAYRSEEVTASLYKIINGYKNDNRHLSYVQIENFNVEQTETFIKAHLCCEPDIQGLLARMIYAKTLGNPLYLTKYLELLITDGYITSAENSGYCSVNMSGISNLEVVNDVVSAITRQVERLSSEMIQVLKVASCMGTTFNLDILSCYYDLNYGNEAMTFEMVLEKLISFGMIHRRTLEVIDYQFTHDKVIQAVNRLLKPLEEDEICRIIGQIYLDHYDQEYIDQHVSKIMRYRIRGDLRTLESRSDIFIPLLSKAASKSFAESAYIEAKMFSELAIRFLKNYDYEQYYKENYTLALVRAQCTYILGQEEEGLAQFVSLKDKTHTAFEKASIHNLMMIMYYCRGHHKKAIDEGVTALSYLGMRFSRRFETLDLISEAIQNMILFRNKRIEKLIEMPETTSDKLLKILEIIVNISTAANVISDPIFERIILKGAKLTAKYGNSEFSIMGYAGYAVVCTTVFGQYEKSKKLERFVERHEEEYGYRNFTSFCELALGAFVSHYTKHISVSINHLKKATDIGYELGVFSTVGFNIPTEIETRYIYGTSLSDFKNCVEKYSSMTFDLHEEELASAFRFYSLVIKNLQQVGVRQNLHDDMIYDYIKQGDNTGIKTYYYVAAHQDYLFNDYERALTTLVDDIVSVKDIKGFVASFEYYYLYALVLCKLYDKKTRKEKKEYRKNIKRCIGKMKNWSNIKSGNYYHKYCLMSGEFSRIKGDYEEAIDHYEQGIFEAKKQGYMLNYAIGLELYADFYYGTQEHQVGNDYYKKAVVAYEEFGALGKSVTMKDNMPGLFEQKVTLETADRDIIRVKKDELYEFIDQILNETDSASMLTMILEKLIPVANATSGMVLLEYSNEFLIKAIKGKCITTQNIEDCNEVAKTIIRYVSRMNEPIRYEASIDSYLFANDSYIKSQPNISILCMPLSYEGILIGILYLENTKIIDAFGLEVEKIVKKYLKIISSSIKLKMLDVELDTSVSNKVESDLTDRELAVIRLAALGLTNKEISEQLSVSVNTTKTHLINIYSKLHANNRIKAVIKAQKLGLLET